MAPNIWTCSIRDFIRKTASGEIHSRRSAHTVRKPAAKRSLTARVRASLSMASNGFTIATFFLCMREPLPAQER